MLHPPKQNAPPTSRPRLMGWAAVTFAATFLGAMYLLTPGAPGRAAIDAYVVSRTTDQHFANCSAARAAGRENIPRSDPSYRPWMDGDDDGLACEPRHGW